MSRGFGPPTVKWVSHCGLRGVVKVAVRTVFRVTFYILANPQKGRDLQNAETYRRILVLIEFRISKWIMLQAWIWATINKIPKGFVRRRQEIPPVRMMIMAVVSNEDTFAWFSLGRWLSPSSDRVFVQHYERWRGNIKIPPALQDQQDSVYSGVDINRAKMTVLMDKQAWIGLAVFLFW